MLLRSLCILVFTFFHGTYDSIIAQESPNDRNEFIIGPQLPYLPLSDLIYNINTSTNDDHQKVTVTYEWLVRNMEYDFEILEQKKRRISQNPEDIYRSRKGICVQLSTLFDHFMKEMGIVSFGVDGYCKDCETEDNLLNRPTHAWNAVQIDGEWYMLDVTWDICKSRDINGNWVKYSEAYFLKSPSFFLKDHLPSIPIWQLSDSIITIDMFRAESYRPDSLILYEGDFEEELNSYLDMNVFERRLYEESETYLYNESKENAEAYAHRLVDKAGMISDSLELIDPAENRKQYEDTMKKIISLCAAADKLTTFHAWQEELYAGSVINYVVFIYNHADKSDWDITNWTGLRNEVWRAQYILNRIEDSYYKVSSLEICDNLSKVIDQYMAQYEE